MQKKEILSQMEEFFSQIGKFYYEEHKSDTDIAENYANLFASIDSLNIELQKIEDEELRSKGLKRCLECQNKVVLESRFCNMCGYKFEDEIELKEEDVSEIAVKKCLDCGTELEEDAIYCPNCGKKN